MRFYVLRVFAFLRRRFACRSPSCLAARMAAAQAGDRVAYGSVLAESVALIRAMALAHHVPFNVVDQVVHATLKTVHGMRHTYDPAVCYQAWLGAIASHHARQVVCARWGIESSFRPSPDDGEVV